jgi:hypothetical protein
MLCSGSSLSVSACVFFPTIMLPCTCCFLLPPATCRLDAFYEIGLGGCWDLCAGALVLQEAGGKLLDPAGKPPLRSAAVSAGKAQHMCAGGKPGLLPLLPVLGSRYNRSMRVQGKPWNAGACAAWNPA